ncbi:acyl carrier protein [Dactylosporangium sp. NBC_01737]|uniref:acyl carrier protein n=1 Tax=Dactylosporangium sp. NBC_01737 TaxID=2975959 RepID=UPI002E129DA2|nr:acyl carrier protein [Dactylosporangium sp. NBC_01737]
MTTAPHLAVHREIVELLRQVTGEDETWAAAVTPDTRVDTDLFIDSLELVELSVRLRQAYGVDLTAYVAGLELPELIELTVGDLAGLVP